MSVWARCQSLQIHIVLNISIWQQFRKMLLSWLPLKYCRLGFVDVFPWPTVQRYFRHIISILCWLVSQSLEHGQLEDMIRASSLFWSEHMCDSVLSLMASLPHGVIFLYSPGDYLDNEGILVIPYIPLRGKVRVWPRNVTEISFLCYRNVITVNLRHNESQLLFSFLFSSLCVLNLKCLQ